MHYLKKTFKILGWVAGCAALLLILPVLIIRIPAVQTYLIEKGTTFFSNKTHTKIEIGRIEIGFPKSISIERLFLEDLSGDTLIYADYVKLNMDLLKLVRGDVHIHSIQLQNFTGNISRTETDSLFNYNFLLTAFTDSAKTKIEDFSKTKSPELNIDKVTLENIRLKYDDKYNGIYSNVTLSRLNLNVNEINIAQLEFSITRLVVDGLNGLVAISKKSKGATEKPELLPYIIVENLEIKNSSFAFLDKVSASKISTGINLFEITNAAINLNTEVISLDKILSVSNAFHAGFSRVSKPDSATATDENIKSNLQVSIDKIELINNQIKYDILNRPVAGNYFDAEHLNYRNINLDASNIFYADTNVKAEIKNISFNDSNGFELKSFTTTFRMDKHSVSADKLKIKTAASTIDLTAHLKYSSLASLKDSLHNLFVNAEIRACTLSAKDALYFSPQLATSPFFNHPNNIATMSGMISGQIKLLKGENIIVTSGSKTTIKADFLISGLPDLKKAYFDLPQIKISTGRNDLENLLGKTFIPENISLPQIISLTAKFKGKLKQFETSGGLGSEYGSVSAFMTIDKNEKFSGNISITDFETGRLLNNTKLFGPVTLQVSVDGKGLDKTTVNANVTATASSFSLNKYIYHNLTVDGKFSGQQFDGKISLNDTNAAFDFTGLVNSEPDSERYEFSLDLKGADLKKLNLVQNDIRISANAVADLKGKDLNSLSGSAGVTNILIAQNGIKYKLDTLIYASINEKGRSELNVKSAIVGIVYNGTFAPGNVISEIKNHVNQYFPVLNVAETAQKKTENKNFSFEIQLHNHPVLSEVFLPKLQEFDLGLITGNFNSAKNELLVSADIRKIKYSGTEINNLNIKLNSDQEKLSYALTAENVFADQIKLSNFNINGNLQNQQALVNISSADEKGNKKLHIKAIAKKHEAGYKISLDPSDFVLGSQQWSLPADNFIAFGDNGFLIHNFSLSTSSGQINIWSVNNKFNDDIKIDIKNFELGDLSRIIEKDTALIEGNLNADLLLKRVNDSYGIIAGAVLNNLTIKKVNIGMLTLKAANPSSEKFTIDAKLTGPENDISIKGYFIPKDSSKGLNIDIAINTFSIKTAAVFSMGQITEGSGSMKGDFTVRGNSSEPAIAGNLIFTEAYLKPAALNNRLYFKNEIIEIKPSGFYFNNFTIIDQNNNSAFVNGWVTMNQFSDFGFAIEINANDFLVFNTTVKDNKLYYGKMIVDSRIKVKGTIDFPKIESKIKLKAGSNFTFAVPEKKLTDDRGEGVVLFVDSLKFHPIITRNEEIEKQKSELKGFEIFSTIEVDPKATLRLLIDPATNDSLVVKGDAALSFSVDPSGKISLTGTYSLTDGSYIASLQSVIKKKFDIENGSTIVWNGAPLDADVNINAVYTIRTSPIDLVADQISGLSEGEKNNYRQRLTFLVYLKMRGTLLKPEISFEIQLPPEDKGALGGTVNAKLNQLNESPSALNKQVFALLVLGRFIQENPLESSGDGGAAALARNSVSSFLTAQLNQLGSKVLPGVELNFNVQSYDDYTSGQAEGRTEVEIGLRKQLFDERLAVQVGGTVDVEGQKANQNNASDFTGDVSVEYKITEDGRYRLKGFRHNQYEGILEGQIVETGAGVLYTRDFDKWKEFFSRPAKNTEVKINGSESK